MANPIDINTILYEKTSFTDVCFISSNKEEIWYSKYQIIKHSKFLKVLFTSDPQVTNVDVNYATKTIKNLFDYIEEPYDLITKNGDDMIDVYMLSHQWEMDKIEEKFSMYITDKLELSEKTIIELKLRNNKHYIKSVENLLCEGKVDNSNISITYEMCKIYKNVVDVLRSIQEVIHNRDMDDDDYEHECGDLIQEIDIALSSIPGTENRNTNVFARYQILHYSTEDLFEKDLTINARIFQDGSFKDQRYFIDKKTKTTFLLDVENRTSSHKIVDGNKVDLNTSDKSRLLKYQITAV